RARGHHIADHDQGGRLAEAVAAGAPQDRLQLHVGLVDGLPAGDRGAVEHGAVFEEFLVDHADVEGDVMHPTARVGETEIDVLDVLILDLLQDLVGGAHGEEVLYWELKSAAPRGGRWSRWPGRRFRPCGYGSRLRGW